MDSERSQMRGKSAESGRLIATAAANQSILVVGADGFVGGGMAEALSARRVVYGPCRDGDTHISEARDLLTRADVVINCGGFRVQPGCTYADYQRSHQGSTSALTAWLRKGALMIQISSASVLGRGRGLGNHAPANPESFPSPAYARAKLEEDRHVEKMSSERGFHAVFLRPAVVYSRQGAGMMGTLINLARRGIALRLYPRNSRQHLAHMDLLTEVARRVIQADNLPNPSYLVVADPYTVTNRDLENMIRESRPRRTVPVPVPLNLMRCALNYTFHSHIPKFDLKTLGEILGVIGMDTVYDPSETYRVLGIDPSRYSIEKTLLPLVAESLGK